MQAAKRSEPAARKHRSALRTFEKDGSLCRTSHELLQVKVSADARKPEPEPEAGSQSQSQEARARKMKPKRII